MTLLAPDWFGCTLLALAALRCWWLLANDAILNPVRDRVISWWPRRHTDALVTFMDCPWCSGTWIVLAWWWAWLAWEEWAVAVAVPFALGTLVGAGGMILDRIADS